MSHRSRPCGDLALKPKPRQFPLLSAGPSWVAKSGKVGTFGPRRQSSGYRRATSIRRTLPEGGEGRGKEPWRDGMPVDSCVIHAGNARRVERCRASRVDLRRKDGSQDQAEAAFAWPGRAAAWADRLGACAELCAMPTTPRMPCRPRSSFWLSRPVPSARGTRWPRGSIAWPTTWPVLRERLQNAVALTNGTPPERGHGFSSIPAATTSQRRSSKSLIAYHSDIVRCSCSAAWKASRWSRLPSKWGGLWAR